MPNVARCFPFLGKFRCTSAFGIREQFKTSEGYSSKYHAGIDLVAIGDKTVVSCSNGTVTKVGYGSGMGNYVWISTEDEFGTLYQHLASYNVKVGDKVTVKQKIGIEGTTGNSTGLHLHFGVANNKTFKSYNANEWIDPAIWFGINNYNYKSIEGREFNGAGLIYTGILKNISNKKEKVLEATYSHTSGKIDEVQTQETPIYKIDDIQGVYKDILFGRRYRVIIGLEDEQALDVSDLRCTFTIKKTSYREPQQSVLSIYNLNPDDENKIIKSGQRFVIEAGYNGSFYGKIFEGNIIQPIREKQNGVDYKLTLVSMDSDRFLNQGIIGCSLVAQQSSRDAINALSEKSTIKCDIGSISNTQIKYPRGKVMFGSSSEYLNQIAKSENATFYVDGEKINIIDVGGVSDEYVYDLSPETGLIGTPTQYEYGINFECLLNPMLQIYSMVHIDNKKITGMRYTYGEAVRSLDKDGIYKIITITYSGDTRGNDWKCSVDAISQAGSLPAMAVGNDLFVFG